MRSHFHLLTLLSAALLPLVMNCASQPGDAAAEDSEAGGNSGGIHSSGGENAAEGVGGQNASGGSVGASGGLSGASGGARSSTGGQPDAAGGLTNIGGQLSASGGAVGVGGEASSSGGTGGASNDEPQTLVFLLLGQSNMVGQPQPTSEDMVEDPRIQVMAYDNCPSLGRTYNEWLVASPPLHTCDGGVGPGDYFARTLLARLPADTTIGLVPLAVNGAPLAVFLKGVPRPGWTLPPDDHWPTGYEWLISRATEAQKFGTISGILFHQGESDADNVNWATEVAGLVADLRADLGIGEEAPFIAGELLETGCCGDRNTLINGFIEDIPNAWVASSSGLAGTDVYHFDLAGQRELGRRYGEQMISALGL